MLKGQSRGPNHEVRQSCGDRRDPGHRCYRYALSETPGQDPHTLGAHWETYGWGPAFTIFLLPVGALIANFYTMADEKSDLRARARKVRLATGGLLAVEVFALWWILTKMAS